jgi:hypothetical protein
MRIVRVATSRTSRSPWPTSRPCRPACACAWR